MKNYLKSDYALNRYSEGIVYRFADKIMEVTLEDYLAENSSKTKQDFHALKKLSDEIYVGRWKAEESYFALKTQRLRFFGGQLRSWRFANRHRLTDGRGLCLCWLGFTSSGLFGSFFAMRFTSCLYFYFRA